MKALIVFSESSEVSFYSVDEEFQQFLQQRLINIGAGTPNDRSFGEDLREALALFFLPVLASFEVLASLKKPLMSITSDDDLLIVFKKHFNYVFVTVSGDDTETEEDLLRKLHVFGRIVCFLYGPALNRMSPPNLQQKAIEWNRLKSLLKSYEKLYANEQSFLLEAVEHIRFGQLNTAQNACIQLAEDCLNSNLNGGISHMKHALLVVGSKVLANCGRPPQLPTADTLLLILLTTNLFCHNSLSESIEVESKDENPVTDENDDFYPTTEDDGAHDLRFTTPYQTPPADTSPNVDKQEDSLHERDDHQNFKTPHNFEDDPDEVVDKSIKGRLRNMFGGGRHKGKLPNEYYQPSSQEGNGEKSLFYEQKVFLQLNPNQYIPHKMHCLEVHPQIILVLISEPLPSSNLAGIICQALTSLRLGLQSNASKSSASNGRSLYESIDESVRRIIDVSKSEAKSLDSESLKSCVLKVYKLWKRLKDAHFLKYLEKTLIEQVEITHVINNVESLIDSLISLFEELYFSPKVSEYDKHNVVSRLQRLSMKLARDYGDYLCTKAVINLPFPFDSVYPGMVHFSYIDRSFDELTTPSTGDTVNITYLEKVVKKTNDSSPSELLRRKIWEMVKRSRRYLSYGYTSQTWMDDHFMYTYCLWKCMVHNNSRASFKLTPPSIIRSHEDEPTGVLCSTYYKDISGGIDGNAPGYINELYCIHEPQVSIETAINHCKSLAAQLWGNTKQALAPFPLIN